MNFKDFLSEAGDYTVANLLGIVPQTVREWRLGHSCPRPALAYKLIKLTEKKLSWDDIYNEYCEKQLKLHDPVQKHKDILKNVLDK